MNEVIGYTGIAILVILGIISAKNVIWCGYNIYLAFTQIDKNASTLYHNLQYLKYDIVDSYKDICISLIWFYGFGLALIHIVVPTFTH